MSDPKFEFKKSPEVVASNIEAFVGHQDDPAWRVQVAEEWAEKLLAMPRVMEERAEEAEADWESDEGEDGLKKAIQEAESESNQALAGAYRKSLEIYLRHRDKDGEIDFKAVAEEIIRDECVRRATSPDPGIFIPFEDYRKWFEGFAQEMSRGDQEKYESMADGLTYFSPKAMTIDNPTFLLSVRGGEQREAFLGRFRKDMADGAVSGLRQASEIVKKEPEMEQHAFAEVDESGKRAGNVTPLIFFDEPSFKEYTKIHFVCEPFSHEAFERAGDLNTWLNSVPVTHYLWKGTKKFLEYLKEHDIGFVLTDKGNNIYAYHLIEKEVEK
jgi:hypothetical protein